MNCLYLVFGDDCREIDRPLTIEDLKVASKDLYGIECELFQYFDGESEAIMISSNEEYEQAIQVTSKIIIHPDYCFSQNKIESEQPNHSMLSDSQSSHIGARNNLDKCLNKNTNSRVSRSFATSETSLLKNSLSICSERKLSTHTEYNVSIQSTLGNSFIESDYCHLCKEVPKVGVQYRCSICNINVCGKCQHSHPMIKLKLKQDQQSTSQTRTSIRFECINSENARPNAKSLNELVLRMKEIISDKDQTEIIQALAKNRFDLNRAVNHLLELSRPNLIQ